MNTEQILAKVTDIFRDVLDNDDLVIAATTTANDVEDWDSLNHMQIIAGVEKAFKIKFTSSEIYQFQNVGDLVKAVEARVNA